MSVSSESRPILVTGAHRSGTTWVGRMLATAPGVGYIHEPFSLRHHHGVCGAPIRCWFQHVTASDGDRFRPHLTRTLAFRYDYLGHLIHLLRTPSRAEVTRFWYSMLSFNGSRRRRRRPLMKDPIAIFSAEWLAETFDMDVVVMIRHPAAFAGSLQHWNWRYRFSNFRNQPALMDGLLAPFAGEIERFAAGERPVLEQAILLWNLIHHVIGRYQERHPEWIFLRHEDLSRDPVSGFRELCERLSIPFEGAVRQAVEAHSSGHNPAEPERGAFDLRRDSRANVQAWKRRLTAEEIERVRAGTADIARRFYTDADW